MPSSPLRRATLPLLLAAAGCASAPAPREAPAAAPQAQFWSALQALCGKAFEGRVTERNASDEAIASQRLVMHVRACAPDAVRIPFHVGEDRSRTWVLTRTPQGLRLKHDHRHADGTEDRVTQYGGDARGEGTAVLQEFPADAHTAALLPAAAANVWSVGLQPGGTFSYALRREGTDRRFRVEFDLGREVPPPPPPWGAAAP
jgi:hypothetical protein